MKIPSLINSMKAKPPAFTETLVALNKTTDEIVAALRKILQDIEDDENAEEKET